MLAYLRTGLGLYAWCRRIVEGHWYLGGVRAEEMDWGGGMEVEDDLQKDREFRGGLRMPHRTLHHPKYGGH